MPVDSTWENSNLKGREYFGHIPNGRLIFEKDFTVVLQPTPFTIDPQVGFLQTNSCEYRYQGVEGQTPVQVNILCSFAQKSSK